MNKKGKTNNKEPSRLNLQLSDASRKRLEKIRDTTDASSLVEVLRHALAVYSRLIELEQEPDAELILRRPSGDVRLMLLDPKL